MFIDKKKRKKRTYGLIDFDVPAEHNVKTKERKYWDLARELKMLLLMGVTGISILYGALGIVL